MVASPDAVVTSNKLPPSGVSPAGFWNVASSIVPSSCAAFWPAIVTETMPSFEMLIDVGVGRNRDRGLERIALGGDERALGVQVEGAGARVGGAAVGQRHLEEALALDRDVERAVGRLHVAAGEVARGADGAGAEADLEADRRLGRRRVRRPGAAHLLVDEVLELDARSS